MDFSGKSIPDTGFPDDDGSADPALAEALAAREVDDEAVSLALREARLLVPVVAILTEEEDVAPGELRREKSSDMAVPTIQGPDGRRALPAFTSVAALARWRSDARPIPVEAARAAHAAYAEEADTLLLDLAGPHPYELSGSRLRAVAEGRAHVAPHRDPDVLGAVRAAVVPEGAVSAVYLTEGGGHELTLSLVAAASPTEVTEAARRIVGRLAEDDVVRARLDRGLDLEMLPPGSALDVEPLYVR
ncbi:SseB family protein [Embleya sp. NPDC008237]|uniref:SseB family protein n=1 Tax=unclassified Embleya TaxID=2699296 RepID=UPI0036EA8CE8